jgi:CelD/BcsL family acetyltransferase involved in cellulose biosynthesis
MITFEKTFIDSRWAEELEAFPDRTIFQTPAWLSFVAKTQNAEPVVAFLREGANTLGFFSGLIVHKFGLRILGSPFPGWTTSYMGLCLSPGISRRKAIEALMRFIFGELRCIHFEIFDRNLTLEELSGLNLGHRIVTGFELDLTQSEDALFSRMSSACRRCIRKAEKSAVSIEEAHDTGFADEYYSQLQDVFAKQSLVPSYGVDRVRELIRWIHPTGMLLLLRARDDNGRCIATGIFPAMNQTMYFWGGASWRQDQPLRPNELIQWYAINYWKQRGISRYDMGGGGEYKRKYGGSEIAVPWFRKSKYQSISSLRDVAQKFVKTRQSLLGKWQSAAAGQS